MFTCCPTRLHGQKHCGYIPVEVWGDDEETKTELDDVWGTLDDEKDVVVVDSKVESNENLSFDAVVVECSVDISVDDEGDKDTECAVSTSAFSEVDTEKVEEVVVCDAVKSAVEA